MSFGGSNTIRRARGPENSARRGLGRGFFLDYACDARESIALALAFHRNRYGDGDFAPVTMERYDLEWLTDEFALSSRLVARQSMLMYRTLMLGNDQLRELGAQRLVPGPSEDTLGLVVPFDDVALTVHYKMRDSFFVGGSTLRRVRCHSSFRRVRRSPGGTLTMLGIQESFTQTQREAAVLYAQAGTPKPRRPSRVLFYSDVDRQPRNPCLPGAAANRKIILT